MSFTRVKCQPGLPICRFWDRLVSHIKKSQVVIVTGETGSGKSTQLPKICLAAGRGKTKQIVCTQPRRIAAISVSKRVSEELQDSFSNRAIVGYKIRFQDNTSENTKVKFVTDGLLLSEMQADRNLSAYDTVILDEAHERSLNIDLLAGMIKRLLRRRRDLKVIITSATMEVEKFKEFFNNPPVIKVEGRAYPVKIFYTDPLEDTDEGTPDIQALVKTSVERIRQIDPLGHILVFLPTERDILEAKKILSAKAGKECLILPLFARLSARDQARIFAPSNNQKIVLATNIAETSITVPGIKYIVDSGLARISRYNVNTHTKALPVSKISKASADQRAGRAGRVEEGVCIRLYSKEDYVSRPDFTLPEILRCNLAEVILRIVYLGQGPVDRFPFVDPPPRSAVREGIHTLKELGALDARERLTGLGRKMARFPLDPRLSRMLIQAIREGCLRQILIIVSAISIQDPRQRPADKEAEASMAHKVFEDQQSDFITWLNLWDRWLGLKSRGASNSVLRRFCKQHFLSFPRMREWEDIFDQLLSTVYEMKLSNQKVVKVHSESSSKGLEQATRDAIHRCVLAGFLGNIASLKGKNQYAGAKGKKLYIFPGSCLFKKQPQWIVSAEQVVTSRLFARTVAPVEPQWIEEIGGHLCKYSYLEPRWSESRGEAVCTEKVTLYGLTVVPGRPRSLKGVDPQLAQEFLINEGLSKCRLKNRFKFNEQNRMLLQKIKDMEERLRTSMPLVESEVIEGFFQRAISALEKDTGHRILDEADLKRVLRKFPGSQDKLMLDEKTLLKELLGKSTTLLYPGHLQIRDHKLPLTYRFCPGLEEDGITIGIPLLLLGQIHTDDLEWLVPGFLEEKVEFILRHLPKQLRSRIFDYRRLASRVCRMLLEERSCHFQQSLANALEKELGTKVNQKDLDLVPELPVHLRMRIELIDKRDNVLEVSRDLDALKKKYLHRAKAQLISHPLWKGTCKKWERRIDAKDLDTLPSFLDIGMINGAMVEAFPALVPEDHGQGEEVWLRLYANRQTALKQTRNGLICLLKREFKQELAFLSKKIRKTLGINPLKKGQRLPQRSLPLFLDTEQLVENALNFICQEILSPWENIPSTNDFFVKSRRIRQTFIADSQALIDQILKVVSSYLAYAQRRNRIMTKGLPGGYASSAIQDIDGLAKLLMTEQFPADRSLAFINQMDRFVRALDLRLQRAIENPWRDMEKQKRFRQLAPLLEKLKDAHCQTDDEMVKKHMELELCLWEFMVSIFAPELSVRGRISIKKLNTLLNSYK